MSQGAAEQTRQSDWVLPMMAAGSTVNGATIGMPAGAVLAATTVVAAIDLTTLPGLPVDWPANDGGTSLPPLGHYLSLEAEGGDVYVLFGPTYASVTGANAPNAATNSAVSGAGALTQTKGMCVHVPQNGEKAYKLPLGPQYAAGGPKAGAGNASTIPGANSPARFLAYVTKTGTANLRVWQSSI